MVKKNGRFSKTEFTFWISVALVIFGVVMLAWSIRVGSEFWKSLSPDIAGAGLLFALVSLGIMFRKNLKR